MTTCTENRFGVRVGDDGRWHAKYPTIEQAHDHARRLSTEGWAFRAQVVDFETGDRETWEDGARR